jgi:hypothetical protein
MKTSYWLVALLLVFASFLLFNALVLVWFGPQSFSTTGNASSVSASLSWVLTLVSMSASVLAGFYLGRMKNIDQSWANREMCAEISEQENPVASCNVLRQLIYTGIAIFILTIGASYSFADPPPWANNDKKHPPPVSAPEPLTLSLIGIGVSGCAGYYLGQRKRQARKRPSDLKSPLI